MLNILEKVSCLLKILPGALSLISFEVQGEKGGAGWWGWERERERVIKFWLMSLYFVKLAHENLEELIKCKALFLCVSYWSSGTCAPSK